jgi:hypothetical protein
MAAAGIIALLLVFLNATFNTRDDIEEVVPVISSDVIYLKLAGVEEGQVTTVIWENKRVGVIKRSDQIQLGLIQQSSKAPEATNIDLESHLWRSLDVTYFVYFDKGDSGYCPLFFERDNFKDTCSGIRYDLTGRQIGGTKTLDVPPYHFSKAGELAIGRWSAGY